MSRTIENQFVVKRGHDYTRLLLVLAVVVVTGAATLPLWAESSWMHEFVQIACYFIFALMWNLLAGYGGMVSIGQQAFGSAFEALLPWQSIQKHRSLRYSRAWF
jgi:hypothetical protein